MSILIGADLVPTKSNEELFIEGKKKELLGNDLIELLKTVDYRIFNLETPLVDEYTPIIKTGPALMARTNTVVGIKEIGADLLTLANNHILDQGKQGLDSTIRVLESSGIAFTGVGENAKEASHPFFFKQGNKCIGVLACAEHEFSIAGENSVGAYGFDPVDGFELVRSAADKCDYLIVLYHGGKEYYRYPSPYLQKVCRKMVDNGADLIVCQHSHCIGCKEEYKASTIVYGQGNFLFDHYENEFWQTSLLVMIDNDFKISYLPLRKNGKGVCLAKGEDAKEILEGFLKRSKEISDCGFVDNNYRQFASRHTKDYLFMLSGMKRSIFYRVVNRLSRNRYERWLINKKYDIHSLSMIENIVMCEAHRELLLQGIRSMIEENKLDKKSN